MTKKNFIKLQAKIIRAYQFIHHNTNKDISAMTFIKRYGTLFRFVFENILNKKSKLYLPFHMLRSSNGEVIILNITKVKYIIDSGSEIKILLEDNSELHIKGRENYQDFLENFE